MLWLCRKVGAIAIAAMFCGCLPVPHTEPDIPQLSGTVTFHGIPVANADIKITHRYNPTTESTIATTGAAGIFEFAGQRRFVAAIWLGDPGYTFELKILVDGKTYLGYAEHGLGFAPGAMSFVCRLEQPADRLCAMNKL